MTQRTNLLFLLSLLVAWCFDFLFWNKAMGISFPIFVALTLAAGFYLAQRQAIRPSGNAYWLLGAIALFSLLSILRLEAMTLFLTRLATLFCMALLAASFLGGRWPSYGISDYMAKLVSFVPNGLLARRQATNEEEEEGQPASWNWRQAAPVLRGLFLALPLLVVLGLLLSNADPIFADRLQDTLDFLNLEDLGEYLWRAFYILILANILAGIYFYALNQSQDETLFNQEKPIVKPFLGFAEAATVLVSVELMFLAFVAVQFRYFFGGEANVTSAGYTYAEYARRGFGELVAVALLSLLLFMLLSSISKRDGDRQRRSFSGLGIALMLLVSIMLVSGYQRLLLYEDAYGFTALRTYAHIFMVWLGLLLLAVVVLELLGRHRGFALAILVAGLGYVASLGLINVDAFIANANVQRARQGQALDTAYLGWLSEDALPTLAEAFQQASTEGDDALARELAQTVACHSIQHGDYSAPAHWQSLNLSRLRARQAWEALQEDAAYQALEVSAHGSPRHGYSLRLDGEWIECGYLGAFE